MSYEPPRGENSKHLKVHETSFPVGFGLHVHKATLNKALTELLSNLNLSIPYNKVMKIKTAIGNACIQDMKEHDGTSFHQTSYLAINNTDFRNDTPNRHR